MERISTGIEGLDELVEGGFPESASILISGPAGAMKSLIGLQYLVYGAEHDQPGLYISIEAFDTELQWDAEKFGWDIQALQDQDKLLFTVYDPVELPKFAMKTLRSDIVINLIKLIDSTGIKRVVFDAITPIALEIKDQSEFRTIMFTISKLMKEKGVTTLFIAEESDEKIVEHVEEFVMDGIIETFFEKEDSKNKPSLRVKKMLGTSHSAKLHRLEVGKSGVRVLPYYY